jgi:transposase-like protein
MYGIEVDVTRVSKITDKLLPLIREWQNRPLEGVYAMVLLDAIHYKVREEGMVVKKAVYIAIGTDLEGKKDVLGLWVGATESSKYWLGVLNGLKNRGV